MDNTGPAKPLMQVGVLEWKPLHRNTLRGFVTVQMGALRIRDITVHEREGVRWVGLPQRPMINDGRVQTDGQGKTKYNPVLEWATKDAADRFSTSVCVAVAAKHPDVFDAP